jgi:hypothetical protein
LVESGMGHTILPYCAVTREATSGRLAITRITKPLIARQLFFAISPSAQAPQAVLQVEKIVREEIAILARQNVGAFFKTADIGAK